MKIFKKKNKILDLTDYADKTNTEISKNEEFVDLSNEIKKDEPSPSKPSNSGGLFGFFSSVDKTPSTTSAESNYSMLSDEKKQRLSKGLKNMTERMEDLSNQIYRLQQRVELLERKMDIN